MTEILRPDICVIGAGAAGLSVAAGAAAFGVKVVLIERGAMGGDCLNHGCIPAKTLLDIANRMRVMRDATAFGIGAGEPVVDFARVRQRVRDAMAAIAPQDSAERFERLGVRVIRQSARFVDRRTVMAGDIAVRARRFVIATGSTPRIPDVAWLDGIRFLTNETIFDLASLPQHLAIIGGGATGLELAQGFAHLGSRVTLIERQTLLAGEDQESVDILRESLRQTPVTVYERSSIRQVGRSGQHVTISLDGPDGSVEFDASHLLLAAGRTPRVEGLGLAAAGVRHSATGIETGPDLRTSNARIHAIGDVRGEMQMTHAANAQAGLVLQSILFRVPGRLSRLSIPRTLHTVPELAQVGLTEVEARARGHRVRVVRTAFAGNDRPMGQLKIVLGRRSRLLGVSIIGPEAPELAAFWVLALDRRLGLSALRALVLPYPTLGETARRAALADMARLAARPWIRRLVRLLAWLG